VFLPNRWYNPVEIFTWKFHQEKMWKLAPLTPGVIFAGISCSVSVKYQASVACAAIFQARGFYALNPLMATLKPQSNGPSYDNTVIGTLAVDEWAVTFGTAMKGLGRLRPRPFSHYCTKCNSPPINGQCTNFILFDVALFCLLILKCQIPMTQNVSFQWTDPPLQRFRNSHHINFLCRWSSLFTTSRSVYNTSAAGRHESRLFRDFQHVVSRHCHVTLNRALRCLLALSEFARARFALYDTIRQHSSAVFTPKYPSISECFMQFYLLPTDLL